MHKTPTLSTKLVVMGTVFLAVALASIGFTLWVTWQLEGGAAAVNEAGRLRMNMLRMVLARQGGSAQELARLEQRFDDGLQLLRIGDPARPLFVPWNDDMHAQYEHIRAQWDAMRQGWRLTLSADPGPAPLERGDLLVSEIDGFVQAIEQRIMRWTAILHLFNLFLVALAIGAAVTFMALGYLLVVSPVTRLQQALMRVRQGDLATRLVVDSDDEFGQLANGFNRMAHSLQASHQDLERKVSEKTASIEEQNQRLDALYRASALAGEAHSLDTLAQGFARELRQAAGADATAVRWSDEANERYLLLAHDGLPHALAKAEHCLQAGACACGQPSATAQVRVIDLLRERDARLLPPCRKQGYETVINVPVRQHHRLLGEVSLLFRGPRTLTDETRELLGTMTQHLANAMEGLRASALEREAAVAQERGLIARELHDSIAQSLAFLKIQTQLLREAIAKGKDAARDRSLAELDTGVRECYADVRELLVHFRTRTQDEDIESALRTTLSKFEHQSGIPTQLTMEGQGMPLASDVQIQVLHIVQEALSNVRKHADARSVALRVQRHPRWRFEIGDDGRGFDPAQVPPDSLHVGLGIMRERAERLSAALAWDSRPGGGTRVTLELAPAVVPLQRSAGLAA